MCICCIFCANTFHNNNNNKNILEVEKSQTKIHPKKNRHQINSEWKAQ